ncbi:MAG: TRAP transporter small permease [Elusimicrobiota bacterium]|jgi:TRAP-type C4-dicarboxylate transport system permease small subunit|nr:TRAP transporter small permease [Elusimicrobiota bacterium]
MNNSFLKVLQKIENAFIVIVFAIMTISAFAQVVNRNIVGANISWFEELARYCMIYMTLIATEYGLRDGTQVSITVITDKFSGIGRKILSVFAKVVVIVFSAIVFIYSFPVLAVQIKVGQVSPGMHLPMAIAYFSVPLSFGIITLVQSVILITMLIGFSKQKGAR